MKRKTSATHPLRVDFVDGLACQGRLGLTLAPGKKGPSLFGGTWDRDLDADLRRLKEWEHADTLVSLLEPDEFGELSIEDLPERARGMGLRVLQFPIRDMGVPPAESDGAFRELVSAVVSELQAGANVVVHCRGGLGRSGLVAGTVLVALGFQPDESIERVRLARPGAIETPAQEAYIRAYASSKKTPNRTSRYRGALLGLAVGDALGTTVEFSPPGTFEPVVDMVGGGRFGLEAGQWTDDTSMALCLAESLVERRGFDARDQMERYVRWWRDGHWSSTGRCFDIGVTTGKALQVFQDTGEPFAGSSDPQAAGNGSLMRLAPVALAFARSPEQAIELAGESSRTTHAARACVDACRYFAGLLVGALEGRSKEELLAPRFRPVNNPWETGQMHARIDDVAAGSFKQREPPEIIGCDWVVRSLEAALYAFASTTSFEEGALTAVNLGDDADTTGAIYGQIAGAHYGVESIPERWRAIIAFREDIEHLADALMELAWPAPTK